MWWLHAHLFSCIWHMLLKGGINKTPHLYLKLLWPYIKDKSTSKLKRFPLISPPDPISISEILWSMAWILNCTISCLAIFHTYHLQPNTPQTLWIWKIWRFLKVTFQRVQGLADGRELVSCRNTCHSHNGIFVQNKWIRVVFNLNYLKFYSPQIGF